jgi:hypothetical protein
MSLLHETPEMAARRAPPEVKGAGYGRNKRGRKTLAHGG